MLERMRNGGCWTFGGCPFSTNQNGVEKDYMTLQINYQEKYEQGYEKSNLYSNENDRRWRFIVEKSCNVFWTHSRTGAWIGKRIAASIMFVS